MIPSLFSLKWLRNGGNWYFACRKQAEKFDKSSYHLLPIHMYCITSEILGIHKPLHEPRAISLWRRWTETRDLRQRIQETVQWFRIHFSKLVFFHEFTWDCLLGNTVNRWNWTLEINRNVSNESWHFKMQILVPHLDSCCCMNVNQFFFLVTITFLGMCSIISRKSKSFSAFHYTFDCETTRRENCVVAC